LQWLEGNVFDLVVNVSASPFALGKKSFKETLLKKQALKNAAPLIHVNLVGGNDDLVFGGGSFAANAQGQPLVRAKSFAEDFVYCNLGRPEYFMPEQIESELESVFNAIVLGTRDFVQKSGHSKIVLGLSGGIDSALVAVMGAKALGCENVLGLLMPSEYSSPGSIDDALALAKNCSIATQMVPIDNLFHSYCHEFKKFFLREREGLTFENIQARIRGNLIMAFAGEQGYLPISTGNRSELATGYCTLYGDMCGGLSPIGDIPKMMVYELAHFINRHQTIIPEIIIDKAPSAELAPHQVDQDTLPPYDLLDAVLAGFLQEKKKVKTLAHVLKDSEAVDFVTKKILLSEFKRKQAPLVLKIFPTSFGTGWRMPVVHGFQLKTNISGKT
jgi:NAD+ synthetase